MPARILVIEDDANLRDTFRRFLTKDGYLVDTAGDYQAAVRLLGEHDYDAIFTDINLTGKETGLDLLAECHGRKLATPIIIITGFPSVGSAAEAVRLGGYDYLCKPVEREVLLHLARGAVRHHHLAREAERARRNLEAVFRSVADALISVDPRMLVTDLNPAAEGFCLFSRAALGQPFGEPPAGTRAGTCGVECRQRWVGAVQEAMATGRPVELYKYECPAQNAVYTLKATPLIDDQGENSGAIVTIRDETRLTNLERDLQRRRDFHCLLIGKSEAMQAIYDLIDSLADLRTTVLITGESGTGKELVAEALHYAGCRRDQALVKVNCSALAETVLESELFGHVRGAITGATHDRAGRFAKAAGGTLFLDEIGDLSPLLQQKLLRVLQEKEFERVGDSTPIKVDVRIIAATNRDLKALVAGGAFREDLYYRLKVVELKLPPLKARRQDIPLLVDFFLKEFSGEFNKAIDGVSAEVMELFMAYPWPGNVRELRHILEHACILSRQATLTLADLPADFGEEAAVEPRPRSAADAAALLQALKETKWNKAEVARRLGISRQTLYRKLREAGLEDQ